MFDVYQFFQSLLIKSDQSRPEIPREILVYSLHNEIPKITHIFSLIFKNTWQTFMHSVV